jgi:hypothetical protein
VWPSAGASIPKGDYIACVEASWIRWINAQATPSLRLVCKSKTRICEMVIHFLIHQRDQAAQWQERSRLRSMADAVGIGDDFDDSDQLHNLPLRMIVWRADPLRISFMPAPGGSAAQVVHGPGKGGGGGTKAA